MSDKKQLHFKTNVQLKSIIGKDLINDDNIAILELVKNSFDADAKLVKVKYLNLKINDDEYVNNFSDATSRLIIQDDGIGMDINDIRDKWLNIAFSEKKQNKTRHNRRMAGAKGVGRFSCDRLGEYLNLYAKTSKNTNYYKLTIDWKQFEIEDEEKEIQSIPLEFEELTESQMKSLGFDTFDQGVLLEIIKLRSNWAYPLSDRNGSIYGWDVNKFVDLKKYLEKLINPNQAFENNDFGVFIEAPEFVEENNNLDDYLKFIGPIQNRIFEELDFKTTSIEVETINNGQEMLTTLKDKGEIVFWIKEINSFYPHVKDAKLSVYYLSTYAKSFFTKQTGIRPVDYGSIFLFINGFRIPPYGDVENDWLGLDHRKAQGHSRNIGLREIVGRIEIHDEFNDFQIISSREGVVKNENFKYLVQATNNSSFFFKAFRRLERFVVEGLNWDSSVYDNKDAEESKILKEIENKILSGKITEEELIFREDDRTKQLRVYSTIHSIISAKSQDVIELYINENLITKKIEEEKRISEREFNQLIEDFSNKKIDADILNKILTRKAIENEELDKQLKEFSKYTTNEATSKAILELQNYKKTIEQQTKLINDLKSELNELRSEKDSTESIVNNLKEKVDQVESDLIIEKEKNLYLLASRRTLSPDADGLIHTIKINNVEVRDGIENLINVLIDDDFDVQDLIKRLGSLKICAERSLKMAEFVTRADLSEDIEKRDVNMVKYIIEYINVYGKSFSDDIDFSFKNTEFVLYKKVSVLNLSIVFDNLINNSIKWGADHIEVDFNLINNKLLEIYFSDNGLGLSDKFRNNPNRIFELAVRDSPPTGLSGSGIGLYYTKQLLNEINCDIEFVGNNIKLSGITFKLTINTI